jgi:hypothetical protein
MSCVIVLFSSQCIGSNPITGILGGLKHGMMESYSVGREKGGRQ